MSLLRSLSLPFSRRSLDPFLRLSRLSFLFLSLSSDPREPLLALSRDLDRLLLRRLRSLSSDDSRDELELDDRRLFFTLFRRLSSRSRRSFWSRS